MGTVLGAPIVRDSVRGVVPNVEPHELCLTGDALRVALYGLRFTGYALEQTRCTSFSRCVSVLHRALSARKPRL